MTRAHVFDLRGRILKGDTAARDEMITIYVNAYPRNLHMRDELVTRRHFSEDNLKVMYLHLERLKD